MITEDLTLKYYPLPSPSPIPMGSEKSQFKLRAH